MKKVLLIILLFIANYSNAQIVRDNFKLMKEQFIFVDTITIDNPIIIIYDYKIPYGPADAIEYLDVEGLFFSSEAYLDRLLGEEFTIDSLYFSEITYMYKDAAALLWCYKPQFEADSFYAPVFDMLKKDYDLFKWAIKYQRHERDYIETEKKDFYYSKIKTNKFALFLFRNDFRCVYCDVNKYYRVAIPIELNEDEPARSGSVSPL